MTERFRQLIAVARKKRVFPALLFSAMLLLPAGKAFSGQATLSWNAPTTNTDGSPLTDLAGYLIYYGTSSRTYTNIVDARNVTSYTVGNLTGGLTYYFAVVAYNAMFDNSGYSNELSKTMALLPVLTITRTGTGTVTSTGTTGTEINCGVVCSAEYNPGTAVTLYAYPGQGAVFGGWTGGGCTGAGACSTTINSNTTVTALFFASGCTNQPVRLARTTPVYYSSLQAAYNAARSGDTIEVQALDFAEHLTLNRGIDVNISGGYDCLYSSNNASTTLKGTISFGGGAVSIRRIAMQLQ